MRRHLGLDVLRGLAVVLVLFRHVPGEPDGVMAVLQRGGWVGVDLFFVLSGFLVSGLLFREHQRHGRVDVGRFLVRRGLKIYPAYYVLLAVTFAWCAFARLPFDWRNVVVQSLYLQNYQDGLIEHSLFLLGHTWTLAIEEHFYLLLAIAAVLIGTFRTGRSFQPLVWISASLVVVCPLIRVLTAADRPPTYVTHLMPTHTRIDALAIGVVLAFPYHFHHEALVRVVRRWTPLLLPCGLGLLGLPFGFDVDRIGWMMTWGLTATAVGSAMLLAVSVVWSWPDVAPLRVVARIGIDSYSIYLWHLLVLRVLAPFVVVLTARLSGLQLGWTAMTVVYLAGSLLVGVIASRAIDWPILAMRDRTFPSRSGSLTPTHPGPPVGPVERLDEPAPLDPTSA